MNRIAAFCFLASVVFLSACQKVTYQLNEEFTLGFHETARIQMDGIDYPIKFKKLQEDSRCPPDVNCFWQGQVAVVVQLDKKTAVTIGQHSTIPSFATYQGHTIRLLDVSYDKAKNFGKERHCSIKLRVE